MNPLPRRSFLSHAGLGLSGIALHSMLYRDGLLAASGPGVPLQDHLGPHHPARAKSVIWIFLIGGLSHLESFDPKPALNTYSGKTFEETPFGKAVLDEKRINAKLLDPSKAKREIFKQIMPLQTGYRAYGQSGLEVSDWFPHIGAMADELCLVRGMWTIDNNHGAQLTFHTGRKITEGAYPTVGSWASYGLGSANENLPEFVVMGHPSADCCGAAWTHGSGYLGPRYAGVQLQVDEKNPLSFVRPADPTFSTEQQRQNFELMGRLNRLVGREYPDDQRLQARIKSYELAFQMQTAVPEVMDFSKEPESVRKLYGLGEKPTDDFAGKCLAARRMVERGVRFIQLFHGYTGNAGGWDSHTQIVKNHSTRAKEMDQPVAGLIEDLRQRGLLDSTLVVLGSEFGRTPGAEYRKDNKAVSGTGRDHHPHGFSIVMAGGGVRGGQAYGATDELGFHAVENRHYVTDLHATTLHLMGLDPHRLNFPGRQRLESDYGEVMHGALA